MLCIASGTFRILTFLAPFFLVYASIQSYSVLQMHIYTYQGIIKAYSELFRPIQHPV